MIPANDFSFFYVTCPDQQIAQKISKALLEEKLIACSNLFPGMQSQYWWNEKIETANECVLILKSKSDFREAVEKRILELHPYDTPCILELPLTFGNASYLQWIDSSLK